MTNEQTTIESKVELEEERERCPYLATDIIIKYNNGVVIIERKNPPTGLALPGGFAIYGLSLEENARKEAREETGLEVILENEEHPLCVFSTPNRDPRAHVVSAVYIGTGHGTLKAGDDAKEARVYTLPELHELLGKNKFAFPDHEKMIVEYIVYKCMA